MNELREAARQSDSLPTDGLTPEQDRQLAELLSLWKGGKISTPVFTEFARIIPQPIIEMVLFRKHNEVLETLLIPRPKDDIMWPGMYHTPGTALRAADFKRPDNNPLNGALERLEAGELHRFIENPAFAGRLYRLGERGPEVVEVYYAELQGDLAEGNQVWYPVDELPQNPKFIQHQLGHVMLAAEQYKNSV